MSTILHLLRGQMSSPVYHLGGKCPHIPFFTGGQMSEGEMSGSHFHNEAHIIYPSQ